MAKAMKRHEWAEILFDYLVMRDGPVTKIEVMDDTGLETWQVDAAKAYIKESLGGVLLSTRGGKAVMWLSEEAAEVVEYSQQERRVHARQMRTLLTMLKAQYDKGKDVRLRRAIRWFEPMVEELEDAAA